MRAPHGSPAALTRAAHCRGKQLCESLRHFTALRRTLFLLTYVKWDLTVAIADNVWDIRQDYCEEEGSCPDKKTQQCLGHAMLPLCTYGGVGIA